ncbi:serine hydrolase domain-containing protein [Aquimarina algiphila]|uniref:serine hydrolase domain-containing protein n=1 Tax=Aquimarina algiphila TaxID=2047982 RepID=UPI002491713E|nr:serine hydrolase domain-containing protein [Aquimarina algiphila]
MKGYLKAQIILSICIIFPMACGQKKNAPPQKENWLELEIDSLINHNVKDGFTGVVLVADKNEIFLHKSYGEFGDSIKTAFWIGSISKQFAASAILKLQESNLLSTHDKIGKFIEDIPDDKEVITIHHLLTHTSGLANDYSADGITNRKKAIDTILSSPLKYKVGEKFSYSAEGYNLLAIIVELISGVSFEDYVSKNLFDSIHMNETGFWGSNNDNSIEIANFRNMEQMLSFPSTIYTDGRSIQNYGYKGATGIYSTTGDLYKWITAIQNNAILKKQSTDQQFAQHSTARGDTINGTHYGYGWFIQRQDGILKEIRHGGAEDGAIGHNGMIRFYDNGNLIIVLSDAGEYNGEGRLNGVEWSTVLSIWIRDILEAKNSPVK